MSHCAFMCSTCCDTTPYYSIPCRAMIRIRNIDCCVYLCVLLYSSQVILFQEAAGVVTSFISYVRSSGDGGGGKVFTSGASLP